MADINSDKWLQPEEMVDTTKLQLFTLKESGIEYGEEHGL